MEERMATINRKTGETDISVTINLDGTGKTQLETGIRFFDHMLDEFARHGLFDLILTCKGDLEVDGHHSIEDCGIALGSAIGQALGEKKSISRFGSAILPMDDALVLCAIDLSGRPYLAFDETYTTPRIGTMETEMIHDFFYAISYSAGMNLHIKQLDGFNNHHIAEITFKAFGKALDRATQIEDRLNDSVWSTKGVL